MMSQYFTAIIFLACQLIPQEVQQFELSISKAGEPEVFLLHFNYLPESQKWEAYPEGKEDEKAHFVVEGDQMRVLSPSEKEELIPVGEFLKIGEETDWASITELPFREEVKEKGYLEKPIQIYREMDQKRIRYWQEEGSLSMFDKFELRW